MCSNAAESFNNWVSEARHLPITRLVDMIRVQIMEQMAGCRVKSMTWLSILCPKMEKLVAAYNDSRPCRAIYPIPTVDKLTGTPAEYMIAPPTVKCPPGRPKWKRIPSKGEIVQRIRCGRCEKLGNHNRKTCKEPM
ncbi:hypothetical protein ACSBR2_004469 [Camellia fascicularis]